MREEEKIFAGKLFCPGDPELRAIKLRTHNLNVEYNATFEDETEKRGEILRQIVGEMGEGCFMQGPIYFHYGKHTRIGKRLFANFNFTVQDDAQVTIGDDCNFGPGVTIVTPIHPMLPGERSALTDANGVTKRLCYARPVHIGSRCWFGANVTVCPGVTVGDGCVIGAGSVITRDIPPMSFAAGVPCRVIRGIGPGDSMALRKELWEDGTAPEGPEIWDAYTRDGEKAGADLVRGEAVPEGLYHLVCEVVVRHRDGRYLAMRRDLGKESYPGLYEVTAGGAALKGEDAPACARRELREETGIDCAELQSVGAFVSEEGRSICHAFFCEVNCDPASVRLQPGETMDFRWISRREMDEMLEKGELVPSCMKRVARCPDREK